MGLPAPRPPSAVARTLLTAFGLGRAPVAPGTAASAATAAALLVADAVAGLGVPAAVALVVLGSTVTLAWANRARRPDGGTDPGWVVSDEVAGQALASAGALGGGLVLHALALVLFRVFDIAKPGPVRGLERLPGGVGVLADDLGAGLLAAALLGTVRLLGWIPPLP